MDWMGLIKIGTAKNTKNSLGKISLAQKKKQNISLKISQKLAPQKIPKTNVEKFAWRKKKQKKAEKKCKILGKIFDKNFYCKKYQKNKWKKL